MRATGRASPAPPLSDDDNDRLSPFAVYEDGYQWPDLYTEIDEMLESNIVIYPLAELRRNESEELQLNDCHELFQLPLSHTNVAEAIRKNRNKLLRTKFVKVQSDRTLSMGSHLHLTPSEIIAFGDDCKGHPAYTVEVNHVRRRVTVCFRGSITKADKRANLRFYMEGISNPTRGHRSQKDFVKVHSGFYHHLFGKSSKAGVGHEIMDHVMFTLQCNPGYKVGRKSKKMHIPSSSASTCFF